MSTGQTRFPTESVGVDAFPAKDTQEPPAHIPQHFITRYLKRLCKTSSATRTNCDTLPDYLATVLLKPPPNYLFIGRIFCHNQNSQQQFWWAFRYSYFIGGISTTLNSLVGFTPPFFYHPTPPPLFNISESSLKLRTK